MSHRVDPWANIPRLPPERRAELRQKYRKKRYTDLCMCGPCVKSRERLRKYWASRRGQQEQVN